MSIQANSVTDYCHGCGKQLDNEVLWDYENAAVYCRDINCVIAGLRKQGMNEKDLLELFINGCGDLEHAELAVLRENERIA